MTFLDIIIAIPLCFFAFKGWTKGIVYEITSIAGLVIGCYAAIHFSHFMVQILGLQGPNSLLVAFIIIFVGVMVLSFLFGKIVEGMLKAAKLGFVNRIIGALLGVVKILCIVSVLIGWIDLIDRHEIFLKPETKQASMLYEPTRKVGGFLTSNLRQFADEAIQKQSERQ